MRIAIWVLACLAQLSIAGSGPNRIEGNKFVEVVELNPPPVACIGFTGKQCDVSYSAQTFCAALNRAEKAIGNGPGTILIGKGGTFYCTPADLPWDRDDWRDYRPSLPLLVAPKGLQ